MQIEKNKKIVITTSKNIGRRSYIKLYLHFDNRLNEYVLCDGRIFWTHFSLETVDDMKRILLKANKNIKEKK